MFEAVEHLEHNFDGDDVGAGPAGELEEAIDAQRALERRWTDYDEPMHRGDEQYRLLRDETERRIAEQGRRRQAKL